MNFSQKKKAGQGTNMNEVTLYQANRWYLGAG